VSIALNIIPLQDIVLALSNASKESTKYMHSSILKLQVTVSYLIVVIMLVDCLLHYLLPSADARSCDNGLEPALECFTNSNIKILSCNPGIFSFSKCPYGAAGSAHVSLGFFLFLQTYAIKSIFRFNYMLI
jgi:hypothetical protein